MQPTGESAGTDGAGPDIQPQQPPSAAPGQKEVNAQDINDWQRKAVYGLFGLAAAYTLYFAAELVLPILFAVYLSLVLSPVIIGLRRVGLPDWLGAAVVLFGLLSSLFVAFHLLAEPASDWISRIPSAVREIEYRVWPFRETIEEAKEASEKINELARVSPKDERSVVVGDTSLSDLLLSYTWQTIAQTGITLALLFFLLSGGRRAVTDILRRVARQDRRRQLSQLFISVQTKAAHYLATVALIQFTVGCLTAAAMAAWGMPNALLWGAMAFVLGFIPYLGPVVTTGAIGIAALLTFHDWLSILAPPLTYAAITAGEGYFISPTILGRRFTLHPISVFLSMLAWTWLWGVAGALLAVPILITANAVIKEWHAMRTEDLEAEGNENEAPQAASPT
ncbi:AI-2E family transporter [Hwanghaeella grinnelliae]|uniref:AI-2E family transporter n=1 Tax=Hwanghaeella grinnelliae TaxID=2500179 RepID=A0A437QUE5_9PROT|nr:AI-2E family transporter [Hwanghaeella grinnelliae]RVU38132.1 AI-2E family transporter [Hwanghaeella grinnelliae]